MNATARSDETTKKKRELTAQSLADIDLGIKWHQMQVSLLIKCRQAMLAEAEAAAFADDGPTEPLDRLADDIQATPASQGDFGDFNDTDLDGPPDDQLDPYDMVI